MSNGEPPLQDGPDDEPPVDDLSITNETELYRRVPPEHYKLEGETFVVRAGAFKNFPNPERKRMSVTVGDRLAEIGTPPDQLLRELDNYGLVALTAEYVRHEDQRIERSQTDEDPAHGDVWGDKPGSRRKRFANRATWIVEPPRHSAT